ncbi:MAG: TRAP transporter fused permease subunit [Betaproteobacteria bacterium]|nr:TRAP transporter fused permease subunit [Betaproteobacteria bacterium]
MDSPDSILETGTTWAALWLARLCGALFVVLAILWTFQVPSRLGIAVYKEQFLLTCLGLAGAAVFLTVRFNGTKAGRVPVIDWIAALLMLAVCLYITSDYSRFLVEAAYRTPEMLVLGAIVVVLVMEGLRRVAGKFLTIVVLVFIAYGLLAHLVPAPLTGTRSELVPLTIYLAFDTNALLGAPLTVATSIVVLFIFLGQVLFNTGGGEFFTDIASATMGRRRGGSAKISVVASALFGSISGSAISNVTTTGVVTIPLMKKSGYSAVDAGAIEANASTGGQFMPPIMGAAAFLMAEFLEIPYADVVVAAIIPALLYYFAIFVQVDLVAAREGIKFISGELPRVRTVLREGWHFIVPFAILLYALYIAQVSAEESAMYAVAAMVILGALHSYKGRRMNPRRLAESFWSAGLATTELVMIVAAAGFVIGILNLSGGGFALTLVLVKLGGGHLFILLLIGALICIVLGMGMPTTGVYVLLAALVAPGLIEAGVAKLPAHMFILYFGMMSMITPPIALAAFAASSLSRADPMETGFASMRMGWVAYVIPFLFVLSPSLLMVGEPWKIALNICTASIGVYIASVAVVGYFVRPLGAAIRVLLAICGLAAVFPDTAIGAGGIIDLAGIVLGFAILAREFLAVRRLTEGSARTDT